MDPPAPRSVSPAPAPPLQHYLHDLAVTTGTPPDEADAIYSALARDGVTTLPQLHSLDEQAWAGLNVSQSFKNTIRESVGGWTRGVPKEGAKGARRAGSPMVEGSRVQQPAKEGRAALASSSERAIPRPSGIRLETSGLRKMSVADTREALTSRFLPAYFHHLTHFQSSDSFIIPQLSPPRQGRFGQLSPPRAGLLPPLSPPRSGLATLTRVGVDMTDARTLSLDGRTSEAALGETLRQAQTWGAIRSVCLTGSLLGDAQVTQVVTLLRSKPPILEVLDLTGNELSQAVVQPLGDLLAKSPLLTELGLGSNRLDAVACSDVLARVAKPAVLQSLDISRNPLSWSSALRQALSAFEGLLRLDVSYTHISETELSPVLTSLPSNLIRLYARGNSIVTVPDSILRFSSLRFLDLSRNRLERLSPQLAKLPPDLEMDLSCNPPLIMPPADVVQSGRSSIRSWLSSDSAHGEYHPRLKVLALGHGGSGKTTLLRNLHRFCQASRRGTISETISHAFSSLDLDSYPRTIDLDHNSQVSVWDFPGQLEESRTCDPFLGNRNCIYLVAIDLYAPPVPGEGLFETQRRLLGFWLSLLNRKLPTQRGSVRILIVGTKADQQAPKLLPKLGEDLISYARSAFPHLPLPDRVFFVSHNDGEFSLVAKALRQYALDILSSPAHSRVPSLFKEVEDWLSSLLVGAQGRLVYDLDAFEQMIRRSNLHPRVQRFGPHMWSECVSYLTDMSVVLSGRDSSNICVQPDAVVRILSAVGLPCRRRSLSLEYVESLKPLLDHFVSRPNLFATIRSLHGFAQSSDDDIAQLLQFMQEHALCFCVTPHEPTEGSLEALDHSRPAPRPAYYFPVRRERSQLVMLPSVLQKFQPRYLGLQLVEADDLIRSRVFFALQLEMLSLADPHYRMFSNAMLLDDSAGTRAVLMLDTKAINVVAAGAAPADLHRLVRPALIRAAEPWQRFNSVPSFAILCPRCIQGPGLYPTVQEVAGGVKCENGHVLPASELTQGALYDAECARRNGLWTPKRHVEFYGSPGWALRGPELRCTVLTATEASGPRLDEYCRVRDLFYQFLHEDSTRSFELDRVVFLDNPGLEQHFQWFYELCLSRFLASTGGGPPSAGRLQLQAEDTVRKDWRQQVLSHFEAYQDRVPGNGVINLVAGWHGTKEDNMYRIGQTNFLEPMELPPESQKDPGYFGKGIYLTQYPSYGAQYNVSGTRCLLVSWAIMGRVYPVIESPMEAGNLLGKGCVEGFDSHYAIVKEVNHEVFFPCKPGEKPDFDELVLFSKHQILPRYIIYYREIQRETAPLTATATGIPGQPVVGQAVKSTVVWVDDHLDGDNAKSIRILQQQVTDVSFVQVTSTKELMVWLDARTEILGRDLIRVVTNRRRERDGGDEAAQLLVQALRSDAKTKFLKVLVYCGDTRPVAHLDDKKWTFVTSDPAVLQKFCFFRPIGSSIAAAFSPLLRSWSDMSPTKSKKGPLARLLIWVEDKAAIDVASPSSPVQQSCARLGIRVVSLTSTPQLKEWLAAHGAQYTAEPKQQVRFVTNRYRSRDGGDQAAELMVNWIRGDPNWKECEVLIFCTDPTKVVHLRSATTAATRDPITASKFANFERLDGLQRLWGSN